MWQERLPLWNWGVESGNEDNMIVYYIFLGIEVGRTTKDIRNDVVCGLLSSTWEVPSNEECKPKASLPREHHS